MQHDIKPTGITLDKNSHELQVTWADDHTSHFDLNQLREACPCAACRGGHDYMGKEYDPDLTTLTPKSVYHVVDIQMVGAYAVQIWWDDGHSSGIYTWDYLRRIDPSLKGPRE